MKYLLDTNTVIYFFKGMGQVADHLLSKHSEQLAISSVTLYELKVGILKSNNPSKRISQLERLLRFITVIPFDDGCAHQTAKIRAELEKSGTPIGPYVMICKLQVQRLHTKEFWSRITPKNLPEFRVLC